jgi:thiosulfate/3-mercaptopyruvate sulfurtransferase
MDPTMKRRRKMKMSVFMAFSTFILLSVLSLNAFAKDPQSSTRRIDPIVSTEWLQKNSDMKDLVILDVRKKEEYGGGHIPKAVNAPFLVPVSAWTVVRNGLILELPEDAALFSTIGSCGIKDDSLVVVVTSAPKPGEPPYSIADATRVAMTLIYAGVPNVAILDGGHTKWQKENKSVTKDAVSPTAVTYKGKPRKSMFASREYVKEHLGKVLLIDARDADVYYGASIEPFAAKAGHIRTAKSLPAPWMWNPKDWTYKDKKSLQAMVSGLFGKQRPKEIITYCGVGGYGSTMWFVLSEVLGYKNVKLYDGSAQEWAKDYDMVPYKWE